MHAVIGKGNLGLDLQSALKDRGIDSDLYTKDNFEWPESTPHFRQKKYDCVWIAAGRGSVHDSKDAWGLQRQLETLTFLPVSMALELPKSSKLVVFSSDYAADEADMMALGRSNPRPKSLYACTKVWMEQGLTFLKRPGTSIVRVGSLYGHHYPERTFPGKLKKNFPKPCDVFLPQNMVTPTPTWWIAQMLVDNFARIFSDQGTTTHHLAPVGNCTIVQWGRLILGEGYNVMTKGFDQERPSFSKLGCSIAKPNVTWLELWERHLQQAQSGVGHRTTDRADHHRGPSLHPSGS